MQVTHRWHIYL